ncbi:DUF4595 domain-containing protein [Larkinella terrae]|uniref:DUF4595 domain-containing protein n=1 Tax=Larkinella terrae TaxID=2025311 RepID=A0A7K0EG22_9BACT|nr:DUF4595 domain-containing protein [Larkinella terrae]MRS60396.1 DUF4595 domain-containing protein [Larkinella terrae]
MFTKRLLFWAACLLVATQFSACDDHLPGSEPSRLRVKSLTQELPDVAGRTLLAPTSTVSTFAYDSQGRLSTITTNRSGAVETSTCQYDAQNRLSQLKRTIVANPPAGSDSEEQYMYSYNSDGQVSELTYTNNGVSGGSWVLTPTYNAANQMISSTKQFTTSGLTHTENHTFAYTDNNLTSFTATSSTNAKQTVINGTLETTYTYDTRLNPFYGVFAVPAPGPVASLPTGGVYNYETYYGGLTNLFNLSPNNVASSQSASVITTGSLPPGPTVNTAVTYSYTYNGSNLPTSRIKKTNGVVEETLYYEYETY